MSTYAERPALDYYRKQEMNPILTPVERLMLENQIAMMDALAAICSRNKDEHTIANILHELANNNRFVLEKSKAFT